MGRPKYQQIAEALKAAIEAGEYAPGDRLPGENHLMHEYEVARMTARQALGILQSEGITEARKGAGVYVRTFRPLRRRGIQRLAQSTWGSGRSVWSDDSEGRELVIDEATLGEQPPPPQVAGVLGLYGEEAVFVRSRRFVLDGKPVLLSRSFLPAGLVKGSAITAEDTGPGGIYARLGELGHGPVHFREELHSRMPSTEETERLRLPAGTPVTVIYRTAFTFDGSAVEVNEMTLDSSAYVLEYDFDA